MIDHFMIRFLVMGKFGRVENLAVGCCSPVGLFTTAVVTGIVKVDMTPRVHCGFYFDSLVFASVLVSWFFFLLVVFSLLVLVPSLFLLPSFL